MADGVDTSIYGNIKPVDPLASLKGIVGLSTDVTNNKLLQLQLLGGITGGKLLQDAIDPNTGQLDINKLGQSLKTNPGGYAAAPTVLPNAVNIQGGQLSNTTTKQNLMQAGYQNLGAIWGATLAKAGNGPVSRDDLIGDVIDGVAQGRIPPDLGKAVQQSIRTVPDDQLRSYAAGGWVQSLPPGITAGAAPAPPAASGAPRQQTGAQFTTQAVGGVKPTDGSPPTPAVAPTGGASAAPPPAAATAAPPVAPTASARPPVAPQQGVTTGLPPGVAEANTDVAKNSASQYNVITNFASTVADRKAALSNLEADFDKLGRTGPLAPELIKLGAGVNQMFGTNIALDQIAAGERANKLAEQIVFAQTAMLNGTDMQTMVAKGANPSISLSGLGTKQIVAMLKGNEDALAIKSREAIKWRNEHGAASFAEFNDDFIQRFDPRIFQSVYMSPQERNDMFASMNPQEQADFKTKYVAAVRNGWIADPTKAK